MIVSIVACHLKFRMMFLNMSAEEPQKLPAFSI